MVETIILKYFYYDAMLSFYCMNQNTQIVLYGASVSSLAIIVVASEYQLLLLVIVSN